MDELRRDMARLALVREQISSIEKTRAKRLERAPDTGPHAMVRLLSRVIGIGIETADMLIREILSRKLRDRRAVARYAGLTGSPDESGLKSREKGLAKAGAASASTALPSRNALFLDAAEKQLQSAISAFPESRRGR
jgi:transposase